MILLFTSFFYVSTVVYDEDSFIRDDFEIRLESARRLLYFSHNFQKLAMMRKYTCVLTNNSRSRTPVLFKMKSTKLNWKLIGKYNII